MKSSLTYVDDEMGISQKDMISGIFCHIWLVILEYDYFYDDADEFDRTKFEGFVHYWRVIGYHLGQVDEYVQLQPTKRLKLSKIIQSCYSNLIQIQSLRWHCSRSKKKMRASFPAHLQACVGQPTTAGWLRHIYSFAEYCESPVSSRG